MYRIFERMDLGQGQRFIRVFNPKSPNKAREWLQGKDGEENALSDWDISPVMHLISALKFRTRQANIFTSGWTHRSVISLH